MRMKKWLTWVCMVLIAFSGIPGAIAEQTYVYKLGDKPQDFTVTMSDGQEFSLYGLLEEKEVVVLNFWATWCTPCRMEFPYLQEAYNEMSDKVGIIALSIFDPDTNEVINDFKEELGLTTLPLGRDIGLADQYNVPAYPTTFVIDRFGVICLEHTGMITSKRLFTYMLETFIGDDYTESILLEEMPPVPFVEVSNSEALSKAANAPGGTLEFSSVADEDGLKPFLPSADGDAAVASNLDMQGTMANLLMVTETKPGDVVVYEYLLKGLDFEDRLTLLLRDEITNLHAVATDDWTQAAARVTKEGVNEFGFLFIKGKRGGYEADCRIRNVRVLTGDEAAAYEIPEIPGPKVLPGTEMKLKFPEGIVKPLLLYNSDGTTMYSLGEANNYLVTAPEVEVKVLVGKDVNLQMAVLNLTHDLMTTEYLMPRSLPFDDEGFIFTLDMSDRKLDTTIAAMTNGVTGEVSQSSLLFPSEKSIKEFMTSVFSSMFAGATQEQIEEAVDADMGYYGLEDGTVIVDINKLVDEVLEKSSEAAAAEQAQANSYVITFTDPDGKPIQGVMAQYCDDSTCIVKVSDENGVTTLEAQPYPYDIHVLMVPAGYQAINENFTFPEEGGELAITINPLVG